jgi:pyruvate-formate lyase-activating enzyme
MQDCRSCQNPEAGDLEAGSTTRDGVNQLPIRAADPTFAAMKTWKILRDCRRRGRGVYWATTGIAHLRNLTLAG